MAPVSKADSVGIWTYEVARRLSEQHEVTVYGRRFPGQPSSEVHEGVRYERVTLDPTLASLQRMVHRLGVKPVGRASGAYGIGYALQLAMQVVEGDHDVIHLHNLSQYAPMLRSFVRRPRLVLHMHCEWLSQIDARAARARLRKVDRVLGCSEYVRSRVGERFPELLARCGVVPNGVDVEAFDASRKPSPVPRDGGTVVFVGRISPEKGIHDLLRAFALILRRRPRAELRIVGPYEPTPREYIVSLSRDRHVRDLDQFYVDNYLERLKRAVPAEMRSRVCYVGEVARERLAEEYRRADVLMNPSLSEAFGMSVVEAMAARVPVVATWVGGMSYVAEEGKNALLVPPADPEALSRAVLRVLSDDELRGQLAWRGRRLVEAGFTWSQVVERTCAEYQRTLSAGEEARLEAN